ncbi:MAG: DUF3300 domain-containing protein [Holophagae bacterium]|nr:MAG: DUF3300 domain-containing protein [Holophagae bacterium]
MALAQEEEPPLPVLTKGGQPAGEPAEQVAAEETATKLPPEQLDSLVAPIALYPDPLLAQTLVASTYPLELVQLQQWMAKNPGLEGDALEQAVAKQPWDPSIQSMAAVPDVVKRLVDDIQWTTDLGNAFLAQQDDVMDAVQRMRKKAQDKGALESNQQQKVETKVVEEKTVIIVESSDPEVIYVPSYSPTVVYGPPVYPYPPIYYPYYPPGAAFVSFSFGVMWGAAWGGSCCHCGWGGNDIDINIDNNFNRNNIQGGNRVNTGTGSGKWEHNSQHRGGTPYSDKATASKYGGSARGDSLSSRQASAKQQGARTSTGAANRAGSAGASNRAAGSSGSRASTSGLAAHQAGGTASRGSAPSANTRSSGSGDRVGSRSIPSSSGSRSGLSGGSHGYSGSSARASSSRGASSMGSMGGGMRGGGGGMRGGGGRR